MVDHQTAAHDANDNRGHERQSHPERLLPEQQRQGRPTTAARTTRRIVCRSAGARPPLLAQDRRREEAW
jgi:hypothetical protein